MSNFRQSPDSLQPIRACTVSRDVQAFGLLVEDMETALGDAATGAVGVLGGALMPRALIGVKAGFCANDWAGLAAPR